VEEGEVEGIEEEEAESVRPYTIANQEDRGSVLFARMIDSGFHGESSCLLSLIRRIQRVVGVYIAYRCMEGVRERRYFYVRTIRWDVTWRAHCDEATREELALVIWQDYSDVLNWNVAF
jgi:hypothetical protein